MSASCLAVHRLDLLPGPVCLTAHGAAILEYRSTAGSGMGWILEHLHPIMVAAVDVSRSRGTGADRLRTLQAGGYAMVCAFGAGRARRWLAERLVVQIHRVLGPGGYVVVTDFVPGVRDPRRRGAIADDALTLAQLAARCRAAGLAVTSQDADVGDAGRVLLARKPGPTEVWV